MPASRSHRALEGSSLPSCFVPLIIPPSSRHSGPQAWVYLSRCDPRYFYVFLRRYGRRSGQPSSSSLARGGLASTYCRFRLPLLLLYGVLGIRTLGVRLPGSSSRISQAPLVLSGGRGEMAMAVASSARLAFLRGAVCACCTLRCCPFLVPVQRLSSRPQPLGSVGDDTPCEDTREDFGLFV